MSYRASLLVGFLGTLVGCGAFGGGGDGAADTTKAGPGVDQAADGGASQEAGPDAGPPAVGSPGDDELTEKLGVFVTTNGDPNGDGTKAHPFASIGAAIEHVKDSTLRVYVCGGLYNEALTLVSGVSVYGSLSCANGIWHVNGERSRIEPATSPAIRARDITVATRLDGFDVRAPAGSAQSPNSIALIAENAARLTVASSKLTSAKAFDGADGVAGLQLTLGASANGTDGLPSIGSTTPPPKGSGPGQALDPIMWRSGQAGGIGSCVGAAGHDGENGSRGGQGATMQCIEHPAVLGVVRVDWQVYVTPLGVAYDRSDAAPLSSAPGVAGADGASAAAIGAFAPDGYTPIAGIAGADGSPGFGGSGGNAGITITNHACSQGEANHGNVAYMVAGPGGGAGGCPGLAGTAGGGGGASVAALLFASDGLVFLKTDLVAGDGGNAGKGVFGTNPTAGGAPGASKDGAPLGAAGGPGGRAGISGNGAPGPSVAIAHTGGAPVVSPDSHLTPGNAGVGVPDRSLTDAVGNAVTIPASPVAPSSALLPF